METSDADTLEKLNRMKHLSAKDSNHEEPQNRNLNQFKGSKIDFKFNDKGKDLDQKVCVNERSHLKI